MRTSPKGILEIAEHEGVVPAPYRDSQGIITFGIGHTSAAGDPDPREMNSAMPPDIDAAVLRAVRLFQKDLIKYEKRVNDAVRVPIKQHEFDALVSFDFNTGGIYRARLTKAINAGDPDASRHFMGWLRPPEIRKRRTAEMRLFETGDYDANGDRIPIYKTNGATRLAGVLRVMSGHELLDMLERHDDTYVPTSPASRTGLVHALLAVIKAIFRALFGGPRK